MKYLKYFKENEFKELEEIIYFCIHSYFDFSYKLVPGKLFFYQRVLCPNCEGDEIENTYNYDIEEMEYVCHECNSFGKGEDLLHKKELVKVCPAVINYEKKEFLIFNVVENWSKKNLLNVLTENQKKHFNEQLDSIGWKIATIIDGLSDNNSLISKENYFRIISDVENTTKII